MSVRNPRTRLISFRLSEDEYRALQSLCDAHEARSLSEFVRAAICWIAYNAEQLPRDFFKLHPATITLRPVTESEALSPEPVRDGTVDPIADAVVNLNRRTDALDRELRRLSFLLKRP
jgi:hypothetical protein